MKNISSITTILILTLQFLSSPVFSKTAEEWKSRTVYQIITDRFARTDGDTTPCSNLNDYCGGTFRGIQNNLDYIQGMGFDAIWISPIVANTDRGYHGYWASDLYKLNSNFGTEEEFNELVSACHDRDIWVMVDVVANHMGYTEVANDYSGIIPFDRPEYYNPHVSCDSIDFRDQGAVETCWLSGLPDLDQNNEFVKETLLDWVQDFVSKYDIDAIRIDTVPHVSKDFWAEFGRRAGVYTLGEILNMDLPYLASYQGPLDSVLNYALYSTLRYAFQGGAMNSIETYYEGAHSTWPDITTLGNFINNHDNPRYLDGNSNIQGFKSSLAFTLTSVGIPIVYYGDEQAFNGGMDPANREPLWTNMDSESDIYKYIQTINSFRKETRFFEFEQIQRYADESFYAFTRSNYLFAFTNSQDHQSRIINFHPYPEGTILCNIFYENDCVTVENNELNVQLINGEVKIFRPMSTDADRPRTRSAGWEAIRNALSSSTFFGSKSSAQA